MKNHKRKLYEKVFSIVLSIIFILSAVPVFAVDSGPIGGVNQEDEDAFSAIGIDTSVVPEGVDLSGNDNPYGKDRVDVIPVYEMFEGKVDVDTAAANKAIQAARLYGDGAPMLASKHEFYTNQDINLPDSNALTTGGYSAFSGVAGNFTGSGQKDKIVTVAAGNWNNTPVLDDETTAIREDWIAKGAYAGLYLYVTDPETGAVSTVKTIQNTSKVIGNIGRYAPEDFADAPYQLQNYLQVATGDFDGDGIDEIAVYVPDGANGSTSSNSRIEVYRLKYTNNVGDKPINNYLDASEWEMAWSYPFKEGTYVSNMVSLLAGDFNRDGTDDLALSWGVYYSSDYRNNSQASILYGSKTSNMLSVAKPFSLAYGQSQLVRAAFAYADINGDNVDEVVLGAQSEDDIKAGHMNTRVINVYAYNGPLDKFNLLSQDNFDLTTYVDENGDTKKRGDGQYYSSPAMVANITPVRFAGRTDNYMIYLDSVVYDYGDDGLYVYDMMDDKLDFGSSVMLVENRLTNFIYSNPSQVELSKYYVEYGAANADFTGNSLESLHVSQYHFSQDIKFNRQDIWNYYNARYWWFRYFGFWNYSFLGAVDTNKEYSVPSFFKQHAFYATVDNSFKITSLQHELLYTSSGKLDRYYALLNMDNDTSFMSYTNKHYIRYTDPKVLAVMASAPYFDDIVHLKGGDNYLFNSSTSFTASDGSSTGTTKSDTLSIGTYFGIDQDITVFGVKVASFEMELAYRHDWTWEVAESETMTQSITYTSIAGQDSVAFYSIPMEIYEYELKTPIVDENDVIVGYNTQIIAMNIPHNASKTVLSLERYEAIAADYPELPQISGTVLKHNIGDPSSYPKSTSGYKDPIEFNSLALVGYGLGSVTQEIEMSEETEKAYVNTNAVDFKVGGGIGSFKAGVTVGYEGSRGKVKVSTSGSTYAATIVNMPEEASDYQYSYAWKLFTYQYNDGVSAFPVVNFIVLDVVEPPKLPQDFDWNSEAASDTTVDLTWSYSGNVSSFVIYRQYDFSGEQKLVPIATVPASDAYGLAPDGLTRLYKYTATTLSPYQDYEFSIQVVRQVVPVKSAKGPLLFTRTKTDSGFPDIKLSSDTLLVYPDTPGTVSVDVSYKGVPGKDAYKQVLYQWQKKVNDTWTNLSMLSNYTTATLKLENAGIATAGEYRCRVDVIYYDAVRGSEYYITGFSKSVETTYQKRTSVISAISTVETNLKQPGLSVVVENPNSGSVKAPAGNVIFVIHGMDYETSYTKSLAQIGSTKSSEARIPVNTIQELPEGIYEITAYYNGDRYFRSNVSEALMYKSGTGTGYWLELSQNAQYGDALTPVLNEVTGQGASSTKTKVDTGITYEVKGQTGWVQGTQITAKSAGTFEVTASLSGDIVAKKTLTVTPYPLTLKANPYEKIEVNTDDAVHPVLSELTMIKTDKDIVITSLPNGDTLAGLGLYMHVENAAYEEGTIIKHDPELGTDPAGTPTYGEHWFYKPGNYTVFADVLDDASDVVDAARAAALANYQITYIDSNYMLISGAYDVVTIPRLVNGQVRGSIEVINPIDYKLGEKYQSGTQLKFEAVPFEGYEVKAWYVGNSPAALEAALPYEEADLPFKEDFLNITMRSEDVYVGVEFRVAQLTLDYKPNNPLFGKVENLDSPNLVSGAVFLKGTEYDFKATAKVGYHFTDWAVTGAASYTANGDAIKVVGGDKDIIVQANFDRDTYPIHLIGDLRAVYYDDLDGDTSTPLNKVVAFDGALIPGDAEVTVMAKSGYEIIKWIGLDITSPGYTFKMLEETTIEAETDYKGFDVEINITQAATTGSKVLTNKDLEEFIAGGTEVILEAQPTYGTVFKGFRINGSTEYYQNPVKPEPDEPFVLSANGRTLTIVALGENVVIEAVFENNTARTLKINKAEHGTMSMTVNNPTFGTINNPTTVFNNEAVETMVTVFDGDQLTFTTTPEIGFQVIYWKEDKKLIQTMQNDYMPSVINADKSITVDFSAMGYYTVNYSVDGPGAIGSIVSATVDGVPFTTGEDSIGAGTLIAMTAVPDPGYMVEKWTVNGTEVLNAYDKRLVDDAYVFVIGENTDVVVSFVEINTHAITYEGTHYTGKVVEVEPSDFAVGDASTGFTEVKDGAYIKVTLVPETGYYLESATVKVNGVASNFDILKRDPFIDGLATGEAWTGEIFALSGDVTFDVVAKPIHTLELVLANSTSTFEVTNIKPYNAVKVMPTFMDDATALIRNGSRVRMTVTPDAGYKITGITVTGTTQYTVTSGQNNTPWAVDLANVDENSVVTVATAVYTPPTPPNPDPGPGPGPSPGPIVVIEDDEVPLGISRLEGATLYEIEFIKKGSTSVGVLTMEEFDLIVEEVIGQESLRIIFANKDPILTDKLTLTMPKAGLQKFLDETETSLEITLEIANLTINRATLTKILKDTVGDEVTLTMSNVNTKLYSKDKKALVGRRPVLSVTITSQSELTSTTSMAAVVSLTSISPSKWSVELPYALKKGEDPEKIEVYYFDTDKTLKRIIGSTYDEQLGYVYFDTSVLGDYVIKYNWISPFKDLDPKAWYYDYIFSAFSNGFMKGVAEDLFDPASNATRAMIASMLYQIGGDSESFTTNFSDVPGNAWFAKGIAWAVQNKIFSGFDNNTFKPNDDITREQLAVAIYNYLDSKGLTTAVIGNLNAFTDASKVSKDTVDAMTWMVANGYMSGKGANLLDPQGFATRAEVAAMFDKLIQ